MKQVPRFAAVLVALMLVALGSAAPASAASKGRVGDFKAKAMEVRLDSGSGDKAWRKVTNSTKVFLVDAKGNRHAADANELTRGARIVGKKVEAGKVRSITLQERGATGSADCSFDSDDEDGDDVTTDDSFDCSNDYDDGDTDTDSDCSYDSSKDGPDNDWSMDASWDCSYSESTDGDEDGLDWDCSYSASAGGYFDVDGGDVDADLDFDCSWSGAVSDAALWDCKFLPGQFGFRCVSSELNQEFEYVVDTANMQIVGGMDFQQDVVNEDTDEGESGCTGDATSGYDCSFDGEAGIGDCDSDWSFDSSGEGREGDLSGDMSYSCSWDN